MRVPIDVETRAGGAEMMARRRECLVRITREGWWGRTDGGCGGGIRDEESVRSVC